MAGIGLELSPMKARENYVIPFASEDPKIDPTELGLDPTNEVYQVLQLPQTTDEDKAGRVPNAIALVSFEQDGVRKSGVVGLEANDEGRYKAAKAGKEMEPGTFITVGRGGNTLNGVEAGARRNMVHNFELFSKPVSEAVSNGQICIGLAPEGFIYRDEGSSNGTRMLTPIPEAVSAQSEESLVDFPEAVGVHARSLDEGPSSKQGPTSETAIGRDSAEVAGVRTGIEPNMEASTSGVNPARIESNSADELVSVAKGEEGGGLDETVELSQREHGILADLMHDYVRLNNMLLGDADPGSLPEYRLIEDRLSTRAAAIVSDTNLSNELRSLTAMFASGGSHSVPNVINFSDTAMQLSGLGQRGVEILANLRGDIAHLRDVGQGDLSQQHREYLMQGIMSMTHSPNVSAKLKGHLAALSVGLELGVNSPGMKPSDFLWQTWVKSKLD